MTGTLRRLTLRTECVRYTCSVRSYVYCTSVLQSLQIWFTVVSFHGACLLVSN